MDIKERLNNIKNEINQAEEKSGRKAGSVKLLAVSKFHPAQSVIEAINAGHFLLAKTEYKKQKKNFQISKMIITM